MSISDWLISGFNGGVMRAATPYKIINFDYSAAITFASYMCKLFKNNYLFP